MRNRKKPDKQTEELQVPTKLPSEPIASSKDSNQPTQHEQREEREGPNNSKEEPSDVIAENRSRWTAWMLLYGAIGLCIAFVMGCSYAMFVSQLHENQMYFSRIETVEREISFRTESGLFFSYFKQFIEAKTMSKAFHQLMYDNITEHGHTINVMERMNIHQEVILGFLFRVFRVPFLMNTEPVYFYLNTIWSLHAVYMVALFSIVWAITGGWAGGILSVVLYVANRHDTTRIWFSMPLRESFSMPFIYAQLFFLTLYFQRRQSWLGKELTLLALAFCTFGFALTWQFAQFVMLLQAFSLYSTQALQMVPTRKVRNVMLIQLISLVLVCIFQFGNTLIPRSLVVSFILASLMVFTIQGEHGLRSRSFVGSIVKMLGYTLLLFGLAAAVNVGLKAAIMEEADGHIYNFVRAKLGLSSPWKERDFDVLLYLCDPSFKGLPSDTWETLWDHFLLLPYVLSAGVLLVLLAASVIMNWWKQSHPAKVKVEESQDATRPVSDADMEDDGSDEDDTYEYAPLVGKRPNLAYHILHSAFFGFMALTTLRFKYLWTPHVCVLAAVGVTDQRCYQWILRRAGVKNDKVAKILQHVVGFAMVAWIVYSCLPALREDLAYLGEFYDPDTVDLMQWIMKTKKSAVFAGSMQLLAGVKLCTGRPITNHPHYEDKRLRERTRLVYQMYSKQSQEMVFKTLRSLGTNYIIVENSICYASDDEEWPGCRLPDIVDRCNGVTLDKPTGIDEEALVPAEHGRFCDEVDDPHLESKFFRRAFHNKTFRVYKLLSGKQTT